MAARKVRDGSMEANGYGYEKEMGEIFVVLEMFNTLSMVVL